MSKSRFQQAPVSLSMSVVGEGLRVQDPVVPLRPA
jgi:hypothetical protein